MKSFDLDALRRENVRAEFSVQTGEKSALDLARVALASKPGVVGTGIGADGQVVVYVDSPAVAQSVPRELEGVCTQVEVVGVVRAW